VYTNNAEIIYSPYIELLRTAAEAVDCLLEAAESADCLAAEAADRGGLEAVELGLLLDRLVLSWLNLLLSSSDHGDLAFPGNVCSTWPAPSATGAPCVPCCTQTNNRNVI
jgi:hypothetical protein